MKKPKCQVCARVKGKRVCKINDKALICSPCCADIRNPDCEGCSHYAQAARYALEKTQQSTSQRFVTRIDPEVDEAVNRALTLVENGQLQAGESSLADLLLKHPDIHTVQYAMGTVCGLKGEYEESIAYFDTAIAIFPYFVEAWFNKATSHQKILDVGKMFRSFQKVIELGDPAEDFVRSAKETVTRLAQHIYDDTGLSLEAYLRSMDQFEEAFVAMENQQWAKALAGFQKVVAENPTNTQSHGNMGICYACLGHKQEALAAFDAALALDPDYAPALSNRALTVPLEEGEKLDYAFQSVKYYKDQIVENKSS